MDETGLSPEKLASRLKVSKMTYRRWLKFPAANSVPREYERNIAGGIYQLLAEGNLHHDSKAVNEYLEHNIPEFFQAAIGHFHISDDMLSDDFAQQDKITSVLSHIGNSADARNRVDASAVDIAKFKSLGNGWKSRVTILTKIIRSKQLAAIDKLVAYGGFFYLILPFDLIPDSIPIFGYVDDFGMLGFAVAYYYKRFPEFIKIMPAEL